MKIAIADDEVLFRKGIISLLSKFQDISFVFEASSGKEILDQLAQVESLPDILLLDLNMPDMNGIETAKVIQQQYPDLKFVVLSTYYSKVFIINMLELGAAAYLPKHASPEEMERTLREVLKKGFSYNDKVMKVLRENLVKKTRPKLKTPFGINLTQREKEVLQLICEEKTTPEIAEQLFISPRTVEGHRTNLLNKLDCRNTAGLVIVAIQKELVDISRVRFL